MNYRLNFVNKPWGYEYLVYENENVSLWFLHIDENQHTSMHCHPKKTTGLILLEGQAELSFLADKRVLNALDKVMIRRGLFHSTKAISSGGIDLMEIETPKDKHDLVRLGDAYGRVNKSYEGVEWEQPKSSECLWIDDSASDLPKIYRHKGLTFRVESVVSIDTINAKKDDDLLVFLSGGMTRNIDGKQHCVTVPGDVGFGKIVKQVSNLLDGVASQTIIMTINKNE